ncbi:hypothetical protein SFRURICE_006196, partial [Spodoptera frugiperda]
SFYVKKFVPWRIYTKQMFVRLITNCGLVPDRETKTIKDKNGRTTTSVNTALPNTARSNLPFADLQIPKDIVLSSQ